MPDISTSPAQELVPPRLFPSGDERQLVDSTAASGSPYFIYRKSTRRDNTGELAVSRLEGERASIGRNVGHSIEVPWDPTVSNDHAVLDLYGTSWRLRDDDSLNGTWVAHPGRRPLRLSGGRTTTLENGSWVRCGTIWLRFHTAGNPKPRVPTRGLEQPEPRVTLTKREEEVLRILLRNGANGPLPATREIAAEMQTSESWVKDLLAILFQKFQIPEPDGDFPSKRAHLAYRAQFRVTG